MTKKQKKKTEQAKPKSRAKYKCPDGLDRMIRVVNLLPPNFPLESLEQAFANELRDVQRNSSYRISPLYTLEAVIKKAYPNTSPFLFLMDWIVDTPEVFQEYIKSEPYLQYLPKLEPPLSDLFEPESDSDKFHRMARKITAFCNLRDSLERLVQHLEMEKRIGWFGLLTLLTTVERRFNGKLAEEGLPALLGTFDDSRLRRCKICSRIFWAKREDSETCTARCFGILRTRRYRSLTAEEKAERKAQRQANRERNKKLKKMKEKKKDESI